MFLLEMILLLQLVHYNVDGKHYLVETADENNSLEENSPGGGQDYQLRPRSTMRSPSATAGPPKGWEYHCINNWRSSKCGDFMKKKGYNLVDDRWQKTERVVESMDEEYDYVEDFLTDMMTCEEKGENCGHRAGRRH